MQNLEIKEPALSEAQQYCVERGLRYTEPRHHVLDILVKAGTALGAYDILERLKSYTDNPKPPTAYRAIEFWQEQGFVHKIESLNSYIACCRNHGCAHTRKNHKSIKFLICDECHVVRELHDKDGVQDIEQEYNFTINRQITEMHGICATCTEK